MGIGIIQGGGVITIQIDPQHIGWMARPHASGHGDGRPFKEMKYQACFEDRLQHQRPVTQVGDKVFIESDGKLVAMAKVELVEWSECFSRHGEFHWHVGWDMNTVEGVFYDISTKPI